MARLGFLYHRRGLNGQENGESWRNRRGERVSISAKAKSPSE
jgi:hypothetical protein